MDLFGWIVLILVLFGFSKFSAQFSASGATVIDNAHPDPSGLPDLTTQNNTNPPSAQPSPWTHVCTGGTPSPTLPLNPVAVSGAPVAFRSFVARPVSGVLRSVAPSTGARVTGGATFTQA